MKKMREIGKYVTSFQIFGIFVTWAEAKKTKNTNFPPPYITDFRIRPCW